MTLGGDVLTPTEDRVEHAGVKGMRWGIRKTPAQRAQKAADKQQFKLASKLTAGELVASALIAGPIGVLGYKAIKRNAASTKRKNSNLSPEGQTDAASKIGIGKAVAVTIVTGPAGLITYGAAKLAAAHQVDDF